MKERKLASRYTFLFICSRRPVTISSKAHCKDSYAFGDSAVRKTSFRPLYVAKTISRSSELDRNIRRWFFCFASILEKNLTLVDDSIFANTFEHFDKA